MSDVRSLEARLGQGEVLILDGAVGTQLQQMGVPMDNTAWAATALETHPYTVRRMHELYVSAGVDVITTNTYSAARHNLEPLGLGDRTGELNLRADPTEPSRLSPAEFLAEARRWVSQGVQIVGGCCGIGVDYIRPLRAELPTHVAARQPPPAVPTRPR